ncbi:MAG: hypothetical protein HY606_09795 [Planctomycetes bacterium]|nr:hypothetical protein [Planctomycetota bacterium]
MQIKEGEENFNRAMELFLKESFKDAYGQFSLSHERNYSKDLCRYYLGLCMFKTDNYKGAEEHFLKLFQETTSRKLTLSGLFSLVKLYLVVDDIKKLQSTLKSLENYNQTEIFSVLRTEEYYFFAGKAYFVTGNHYQAKNLFNSLLGTTAPMAYHITAKLLLNVNSSLLKFGRFQSKANGEKLLGELKKISIDAQIVEIDGHFYVIKPFHHTEKDQIISKLKKSSIEYEILP